jgi:hypothetical protein
MMLRSPKACQWRGIMKKHRREKGSREHGEGERGSIQRLQGGNMERICNELVAGIERKGICPREIKKRYAKRI